MRSFTLLRSASIAALLAVGTSAAAIAADMMPPPPPMMHAPPPVLDVGGGFYLRGDVGLGLYDHSGMDTLPPLAGLTTTHSSINGTGFFSIGAGYQFNSFLRADVTAEYRAATSHRHHDSFNIPAGNGSNVITGKIDGIVTLANAYVDLGTWHRITPFVGAGIGFASMTMSKSHDTAYGVAFGSFGDAPNKTQTRMAWALHAGLGYDLTANWKAEAAYRYLHVGNVDSGQFACTPVCAGYKARIHDLSSHDLKVGLRYVFNDTLMMMPEPLVRKY